MLQLSVVTSAEHQKAAGMTNDDNVPHGAAVLRKLSAPWAGTQRVVCADSYFASVPAAIELRKMGLRLSGVLKTATRGFPMQALSTMELDARGDYASYTHTTADGVVDLMAVVWVDRERRYFISSSSTTLPGEPYERIRWRQIDGEAKRVLLTVKLPRVAQEYYECCAAIDRHNRCRQDDLRLEHKLVTHDWSKRVGMSLLGMCAVDAWMLYTGARGATASLTQKQFYEDLAAQLIGNTFDAVGIRARRSTTGSASTASGDMAVSARYGLGIHLEPTLKRRGPSAADGDQRAQRGCRVCKWFKSCLVCSGCRGTYEQEVFLCSPKTGRHCLDVHLREVHEVEN